MIGRVPELLEFVFGVVVAKIRGTPPRLVFCERADSLTFPFFDRYAAIMILIVMFLKFSLTPASCLVVAALLVILWLDRYMLIAMASKNTTERYHSNLLYAGSFLGVIGFAVMAVTVVPLLLSGGLNVRSLVPITAVVVPGAVVIAVYVWLENRRPVASRAPARSVLKTAGAETALQQKLLDGWASFEIERLHLAYRPPDTVAFSEWTAC
jgi:hypothetical protein